MNDVAALAAADVGIAMGSGPMLMEAAPVTLMRPERCSCRAAREIARQTAGDDPPESLGIRLQRDRHPASSRSLLSPAFAGGAMALSSVNVVGNALRLTRWKPGMKSSRLRLRLRGGSVPPEDTPGPER
ncbi:MAG: hypothetical protein H6883_13695 [Rhodobiaceae bacterium]|nr:hypothetical protein [Rhodobiaceae bacterium]